MSEKLEKLIAELDALTLMEAAELSKMLQEKWGVSAAAPMMMGAMPMLHRSVFYGDHLRGLKGLGDLMGFKVIEEDIAT